MVHMMRQGQRFSEFCSAHVRTKSWSLVPGQSISPGLHTCPRCLGFPFYCFWLSVIAWTILTRIRSSRLNDAQGCTCSAKVTPLRKTSNPFCPVTPNKTGWREYIEHKDPEVLCLPALLSSWFHYIRLISGAECNGPDIAYKQWHYLL